MNAYRFGLIIAIAAIPAHAVDLGQTYTIEDKAMIPATHEITGVIDSSSRQTQRVIPRCYYKMEYLDLDGDGKAEDVFATATEDACISSVSNGLLFVLRFDGVTYHMAYQGVGYSITVLPSKHDGLFDLFSRRGDTDNKKYPVDLKFDSATFEYH